jgi:hypothetical protein
MDLKRKIDEWRKALWAELGDLMRTKKLEPAPASAFPLLARLLDIEEPDERTGQVLRSRLKHSLEELAAIEDESEDKPLARPAMVLLGFTPRSEHKGIGARRRLAAPLRGVAVSTMRRQEMTIAEEVGIYLLLRRTKYDDS